MTAKVLMAATMAVTFSMLPAMAQGFTQVTEKDAFMQLISGKQLTRFGISLDVRDEGTIEGRAFGRKVTGAWDWQNGYFCRVMYWGKTEIAQNCQEVRVDGDMVRFTSDQGTGDFADLRMK